MVSPSRPGMVFSSLPNGQPAGVGTARLSERQHRSCLRSARAPLLSQLLSASPGFYFFFLWISAFVVILLIIRHVGPMATVMFPGEDV